MSGPVKALPHAVSVVLAANTPSGRLWAISSTLEICRSLGRDRRTVLVDLQRHTPSALAAALDVEQTEGIVDVLFRGVSISTVMGRPQSEAFFFVPFGGAAPERSSLFNHPRWTRIAGRLPGANATLLLCVSADDWLEAGPIGGFEACIVVNGAAGEPALPPRARRVMELGMPSRGRASGDPAVELPDYAVSETAARAGTGSGTDPAGPSWLFNGASRSGPGVVLPQRPFDPGYEPASPPPRRPRVVLLPPPYEDEFGEGQGPRGRWRAWALSAALAAIALAVLGLLV